MLQLQQKPMYHIFLETSEQNGFDCNKYPHIIYFWKPQSKYRLLMVTPVILTVIRKIMMIRISSKFKDVLDGFNCIKYPCITYFWKPQQIQIDDGDSSHLDIHQKDDDQDVLQVQGWILMDLDGS